MLEVGKGDQWIVMVLVTLTCRRKGHYLYFFAYVCSIHVFLCIQMYMGICIHVCVVYMHMCVFTCVWTYVYVGSHMCRCRVALATTGHHAYIGSKVFCQDEV